MNQNKLYVLYTKMQEMITKPAIPLDTKISIPVDVHFHMVVEKKANSTATKISFTDKNHRPIVVPKNIKVYNHSYKKEIKTEPLSTHFDLCWDESYTITHDSKVIKWNQIPVWNFITSRK